MKLSDRPPLVVGAERLPWGEPSFSDRMLVEHLDDRHDMASRRPALVDEFVEWLDRRLDPCTRVLDLGCGPGLYCERLSRLGHCCVGVDIGPASLRAASVRGVHSVRADIRRVPLRGSFDAVLLLYGELNTFPPSENLVVPEIARLLRPRALAVLEVSTDAAVRRKAKGERSWPADGGLFADGPHVVFHESAWDDARRATVERWSAVDASDDVISAVGTTTWCVTDDDIERAGLTIDERFGSHDDEFQIILARA